MSDASPVSGPGATSGVGPEFGPNSNAFEIGLEVVLASASPRRLELLRRVGIEPTVVAPEVDETRRGDESPQEYVTRLAKAKAHAVATARPGAAVVAADTTVVLDGATLGKPRDRADAVRMVASLAGRTHQVCTGVCVASPSFHALTLAVTDVTFGPLSRSEVEWYVGVGESMDKAGAYAIQGVGAALVERIDGSYTNVVGLPLRATLGLLRRAAGNLRDTAI